MKTISIVWNMDDKGFIKIYRTEDNGISVLLCECNESLDDIQESEVWMLDLIEDKCDIVESDTNEINIQKNDDNKLVLNKVGVLNQSDEYYRKMNKYMNDRKEEKKRRNCDVL